MTVDASWELAGVPKPSSTELTINILGGGCGADEERLGDIEVRETPERIVISATIVKPESSGGDCPAVGRGHEATVVLREPLAGRELVDPTCTPELLEEFDCRPTAVE